MVTATAEPRSATRSRTSVATSSTKALASIPPRPEVLQLRDTDTEFVLRSGQRAVFGEFTFELLYAEVRGGFLQINGHDVPMYKVRQLVPDPSAPVPSPMSEGMRIRMGLPKEVPVPKVCEFLIPGFFTLGIAEIVLTEGEGKVKSDVPCVKFTLSNVIRARSTDKPKTPPIAAS